MSETFERGATFPGQRTTHKLAVEFDIVDAAVTEHLPECGPGVNRLPSHPKVGANTETVYFIRETPMVAVTTYCIFQATFNWNIVQLAEVKLQKMPGNSTKLHVDKAIQFSKLGILIKRHFVEELDAEVEALELGVERVHDITLLEEYSKEARAISDEYLERIEEEGYPSMEELKELHDKRSREAPIQRRLQSTIITDLFDRLRSDGLMVEDESETSDAEGTSDEPWFKIKDHNWHRQALELWWSGYTGPEIGKRVHLAENTVRNQLTNLRKQYGEDIVPTASQLRKMDRR